MRQNFLVGASLILLVSCMEKQQHVVEKKDDHLIQVKAGQVKEITASANLRYSGTVEASQTIPLSFQSTGIVEQVLVKEGDVVRKGQLLAFVNKADNQNIYNSSLAMYGQAKDAYDRLKQVHDKGSLADVKWIEMETNLKQSESQMQIAKNNLDKCNLYAPDNGVIGRRNVEQGQSALSISAPFELVKIETVSVKIAVPENEIGKIKKGLKASITVSALDHKDYEGVVTNVGVVADQFSHTYEVKISVNNPEMAMKPGMVCDVTTNVTSDKQIVVVPFSSVSNDTDGNAFVFLVDNNKRVRKQIIVVGNYYNSDVEVLRGLSPNQTIVTEGKEKLSDNSLINF